MDPRDRCTVCGPMSHSCIPTRCTARSAQPGPCLEPAPASVDRLEHPRDPETPPGLLQPEAHVHHVRVARVDRQAVALGELERLALATRGHDIVSVGHELPFAGQPGRVGRHVLTRLLPVLARPRGDVLRVATVVPAAPGPVLELRWTWGKATSGTAHPLGFAAKGTDEVTLSVNVLWDAQPLVGLGLRAAGIVPVAGVGTIRPAAAARTEHECERGERRDGLAEMGGSHHRPRAPGRPSRRFLPVYIAHLGMARTRAPRPSRVGEVRVRCCG